MRIIKVKRPFEGFNKNCSYNVFIGKKRMAKLKNGEERTIEIAANVDYVTGKIFWCGSKQIKLNDTFMVEEFEIRGSKFLNRTFPLLAIIPLSGISLTMNSNHEIIKLVGLSLLILLLAFVLIVLTIKKDKWLIIKRVN